ncbi:MAG: AtpZ/AtpI family protein [Parafilimonas sp.]
MIEEPGKNKVSNKTLLIQYASIGSQMLAGLIIAVFAGKWIDGKLHFSFPIFIWLLPLIFIVGMILKVIKDTSKKKNG